MSKVYVGTSGWSYKHWGKNIFYPENLKMKSWLEFYSQFFDSVEINSSFYHQVKPETYQLWRANTPKGFIFSIKISRYITHFKKLEDSEGGWQNFIKNANNLEEKLGPILMQLPPSFSIDAQRLRKFLQLIPNRFIKVFEFRHQSWFKEEIYDILKKNNSAFVINYGDNKPLKEVITADFIYIRLHGPSNRFRLKYTDQEIEQLAKKINSWRREVKNIYAYFNNDAEGYAIENAKKLKELT